MSIQSEIDRIKENVSSAFSAVVQKGGTAPQNANSQNLAAAVSSIPVGVTEERLQEALSGKQDKLTGLPGQAVGFNAAGAAVAVQGWSNPNLLINGHFAYPAEPINQKGQTTYSGTYLGLYAIDMWTVLDGTIELLPDGRGLQITLNRKYSLFRQRIERRIDGPATASVLIENLVGSLYLAFQSTDSIALYKELSQDGLYAASGIAVPTANSFVIVNKRDEPASFILKAAKLELGSQQTLAHQDADGKWILNDPPPDPALELAKCQRYFQIFSAESLRPAKAVDFRPPMRIDPVLGTIVMGGTTYYTADANL